MIADAILKDVKGFNYERAYQAMKASMMSDYKGLSYVTDLEYIPADKENESVAKGLEYAIADWGVAQVARKLGKTEDYEYFSKLIRTIGIKIHISSEEKIEMVHG